MRITHILGADIPGPTKRLLNYLSLDSREEPPTPGVEVAPMKPIGRSWQGGAKGPASVALTSPEGVFLYRLGRGGGGRGTLKTGNSWWGRRGEWSWRQLPDSNKLSYLRRLVHGDTGAFSLSLSPESEKHRASAIHHNTVVSAEAPEPAITTIMWRPPLHQTPVMRAHGHTIASPGTEIVRASAPMTRRQTRWHHRMKEKVRVRRYKTH